MRHASGCNAVSKNCGWKPPLCSLLNYVHNNNSQISQSGLFLLHKMQVSPITFGCPPTHRRRHPILARSAHKNRLPRQLRRRLKKNARRSRDLKKFKNALRCRIGHGIWGNSSVAPISLRYVMFVALSKESPKRAGYIKASMKKCVERER